MPETVLSRKRDVTVWDNDFELAEKYEHVGLTDLVILPSVPGRRSGHSMQVGDRHFSPGT